MLKVQGVFLAEVGWLRSLPLSKLGSGGGREESWPRFPLWGLLLILLHLTFVSSDRENGLEDSLGTGTHRRIRGQRKSPASYNLALS